MSDTPETPRRAPRALTVLAGIAIVFLLLAGLYVGYQTMHILFPPNTYETAMLATVSDTVDAEGVLLFNESYVAGGGTLGYLPAAHPAGRPDRPAAKIAECFRNPAGHHAERAFLRLV